MHTVDGSSDKIKIGILGAGSVVELYHLPVLSNMPNVNISWLCDRVENRAQRLAKVYSISKVYMCIEECTDVDIVLVAIPVGFRREPLQYIFQRGWHVLCEKPFAVSLAEHDAILYQASEIGVQVGVGLMRRYYRTNALAKQLLQVQVFGAVEEVWASEGTRMRGTGREEGWYLSESKAAGGGILLETGSHLVDQVFTILNVLDFRVQESWQCTFNALDFETRVVSTVATSNQSEIKFTLALSWMKDLYNGIVIRFHTGTLKFGLLPGDRLLLCTRDGLPLAHLEAEKGARHVYQAFYLEWQDFIAQCTSSHKSAISAETARQSTAFIEACYRSARAMDMHKGHGSAAKLWDEQESL